MLNSDTIAYISVLDITDKNEISAIDELVISLKSENLWNKMKAIYPHYNLNLKTAKKEFRKKKINSIIK